MIRCVEISSVSMSGHSQPFSQEVGKKLAVCSHISVSASLCVCFFLSSCQCRCLLSDLEKDMGQPSACMLSPLVYLETPF